MQVELHGAYTEGNKKYYMDNKKIRQADTPKPEIEDVDIKIKDNLKGNIDLKFLLIPIRKIDPIFSNYIDRDCICIKKFIEYSEIG